jgi:hypothetical protein
MNEIKKNEKEETSKISSTTLTNIFETYSPLEKNYENSSNTTNLDLQNKKIFSHTIKKRIRSSYAANKKNISCDFPGCVRQYTTPYNLKVKK